MRKTLLVDRCRPWLAPTVAIVATLIMASPGIASPGHEAHDGMNGYAYIWLSSDRNVTMMSGSTADLKQAQALRTDSAPLLYVRRDGKAFVVRDAATLEKVRVIFEPQRELGRRQAALGKQQAALGKQQAALGRQQAEIARAHVSGQSSAQAQEQGELGRRQGELGAQQSKLGEQQSALGREQRRLGREAEAKFRALVDETLRRGLATPV